MRQTDNYELPELIRAMSVLLQANVQLVSSSLDEAMVLQKALIDIVGLGPRKAADSPDRCWMLDASRDFGLWPGLRETDRSKRCRCGRFVPGKRKKS
jgi:hypothetical protein